MDCSCSWDHVRPLHRGLGPGPGRVGRCKAGAGCRVPGHRTNRMNPDSLWMDGELAPARRSAGPPVVIGIPRLVPAAYAEQEPGIAEVKRMAGYFPHVEGIDRIAR